jgi:acyl carrier protein
MSRRDVFERIAAVVRQTFGVDDLEISRETVAGDIPGWDSLSHTVVMLAIEQALGVSIPNSVQYRDIGELVDQLADRVVLTGTGVSDLEDRSRGAATELPADADEYMSQLLAHRDVIIHRGPFAYPCRFRLLDGATYLSVQLHGDRGTAPLPRFARWNYGPALGSHVLSICDPTLYLYPTVSLAWYLGTQDHDATEGVVDIAMNCAKLVGIPPERVVFAGSSGGGFAALRAAAMTSAGRAIAINPQTNLMKHLIGNYVASATGYASLKEARPAFGARWNAIHTLQNAIDRGRQPRVVYVQNTNDTRHMERHFGPFAQAFGLSVSDPVSVRDGFMSILYAGPNAHGGESPDEVKRIRNEGVPFLFAEPVDGRTGRTEPRSASHDGGPLGRGPA